MTFTERASGTAISNTCATPSSSLVATTGRPPPARRDARWRRRTTCRPSAASRGRWACRRRPTTSRPARCRSSAHQVVEHRCLGHAGCADLGQPGGAGVGHDGSVTGHVGHRSRNSACLEGGRPGQQLARQDGRAAPARRRRRPLASRRYCRRTAPLGRSPPRVSTAKAMSGTAARRSATSSLGDARRRWSLVEDQPSVHVVDERAVRADRHTAAGRPRRPGRASSAAVARWPRPTGSRPAWTRLDGLHGALRTRCRRCAATSRRGRTRPAGRHAAVTPDVAASWPQAPSISRPRVSRTVVGTPLASSRRTNSSLVLAPRRRPLRARRRVQRDQVDVHPAPVAVRPAARRRAGRPARPGR